MPRDRNGHLEPQLLPKRQTRMPSLEEKITSLYGRGMATREIQGHLQDLYLALGINLDGEKELLGMWISESEGAKFWAGVLTELKNRGVEDILFCCVDGLTGFEEAITAVYPQTIVQLCIVHMVRNSYAS